MTEKKIQRLIRIFYSFCKNNHGVTFYDYQKEIIEKVLRAIFFQTGEEIFVEISRQAGKTESIVSLIEFVLIFFPECYDRPIRIGIFAPQKEQTKTDTDRLKLKLEKTNVVGFTESVDPNESNAVTLQINNKSYVYSFPLSSTSSPESKTLDVIFYEEAHKIEDFGKTNKSDPMGSSTNAVKVNIGVAGYSKNFFKRGIDKGLNIIKADYKKVIADRRKKYEEDQNPYHLNYEAYVKKIITEAGEDDDAFQTQYALNWKIGVGQFITPEVLYSLRGNFGLLEAYDGPVTVGIDTAKHPDRTIVTVKNLLPIKNKEGKEVRPKSILNWLRLQGDNYEDQFYIILRFLKNYPNIVGIAIDSTGQGDFMPDMFENHTAYQILRVKFNLDSKDKIYKNLIVQIQNQGTKYPYIQGKQEVREFEAEALDLEKEYKGEYLSCHHPKNDPEAHDDYMDSWALAEYAEKWLYENQPDASYLIHGSSLISVAGSSDEDDD